MQCLYLCSVRDKVKCRDVLQANHYLLHSVVRTIKDGGHLAQVPQEVDAVRRHLGFALVDAVRSDSGSALAYSLVHQTWNIITTELIKDVSDFFPFTFLPSPIFSEPPIPRACGTTSSRPTLAPPALWPMIVTFWGSPRKNRMFWLIHFRASIWSKRPALPWIRWSPDVRKPNQRSLDWQCAHKL